MNMADITIALAEDWIEDDTGKKYKLTPPNYNTHRAYTTYLEQMALEAIQRNKKSLGREYQETRSGWATACARGDYEWGGRACAESFDSTERVKEFCFLTMCQSNENLPRQEFERIWSLPDKFKNPETGEEEDGIKGHNIWIKILGFLKRPN
jgi:hypothetical protein